MNNPIKRIKFTISIFIVILFNLATGQNIKRNISTFKGTHYALYTKCGQAITFCELTQQDYTSCGSVKNCYGLYVMPGDTFLVNIEDKTQSEILAADLSFDNYFPSISSFTFLPIDNNCVPQQALQICIPLNAIPGASFQIVAQNTHYVVNTSLTSSNPQNYYIFVGGQQPQFTFSLSDFTVCPLVDDVSIETDKNYFSILNDAFIYPNPTHNFINIDLNNLYFNNYFIELKDLYGKTILSFPFSKQIDVSNLPQGLYFLSVKNNEFEKNFKFIKL